MTRIWQNPAVFSDDVLDGFVDLYRDQVTRVPGGVVRAFETAPGQVAVVVAGGSGHYPAFCGFVGDGLAAGAVVGNVFTSPSASDAVSVARAAASDSGVIFIAGNYAGDVMNLDHARDILNSEGVPARSLYVTDDIASAPLSEIEKRRGIAGNLIVFKIAGAAAENGYSLDDLERVSRLANSRTRTLGVAFAGCTLPGESAPLFSVPQGQMAIGLGIHGEPGISTTEILPASELAELLTSRVLEDLAPKGRQRIAVILNGLGATKSEELFVLWKYVALALKARGHELVDVEVGEIVTSLDMAGCSLTVTVLDEELERLWLQPAYTPAFTRHMIPDAHFADPGPARQRTRREEVIDTTASKQGSSVSVSAEAERVLTALRAMEKTLVAAQEELGRLDAVAGDGDHGRGMVKGIKAAVEAAEVASSGDISSVLESAGRAWADRAGGTSGMLWGAGIEAAARAYASRSTNSAGASLVSSMTAAIEQIQAIGHARVGDKTLLDALVPFVDALSGGFDSGKSVRVAWADAAAVAHAAAQETAKLTPRVGRARPLAERSVGTPDPGAVSLAMCLQTVVAALPRDPSQALEDD